MTDPKEECKCNNIEVGKIICDDPLLSFEITCPECNRVLLKTPKEEKPVDPDWEQLDKAYHDRCHYEIIDEIYEFLKAKYGK